MPGATAQLQLRQGISFAGEQRPLVVLNGVILYQEHLLGTGDPLTFLNPNDIASITVLKDAAATARYGSLGSKGVIVVETQKASGPGDSFSLSLSTTGTMATAQGKVSVLSADQFREVVREKIGQEYTDKLGAISTDWQEEIYRTAYGADNQLNISGAWRKLPYHVSVGYLNQNGVLQTAKLKRTSAALSLQPSLLHDHLKLNLNLRRAAVKTTFADASAIRAAAFFDPTKPVHINNKYGDYFTYTDASGDALPLLPANPLSLLEQPEDVGTANRTLASIATDYAFHFLPDLHANLQLSLDHIANERAYKGPRSMPRYHNQNGLVWENEQNITRRHVEFSLGYGRQLQALRSEVYASAGFGTLHTAQENILGTQYDVEQRPLAPGSSSSGENKWLSQFGQLQYTFAKRLSIDATLRRDGTSTLSDAERYHMSRALGVAWDATGLDFPAKALRMNSFNLQGSYGVLGSVDVPQTFTLQSTGGSSGGIAGTDAKLRPSVSRKLNFGFGAGWLQDRLLVQVDAYRTRTEDLILALPVPTGTNLNGYVMANQGSYSAKGLEWDVLYRIVSKQDWSWSVGLNGAYERNEVEDLGDGVQGVISGYAASGVQVPVQGHVPGLPKNSYLVYKQLYGANGKPLLGQYADLNGDKRINELDVYSDKSSGPSVHGGFRTAATYKRAAFSLGLRGQWGNYTYNGSAAAQGNYNTMLGMLNRGVLLNADRSVLNTGFEQAQLISNFYIQDASFLRVEYVQLSYGFGPSFKDRPLLRLTATLQNAYTFTSYKGGEPGIAGGIDAYSYATPRMASVGLEINLH